MTMTIQGDPSRASRWALIAVLVSGLLLTAAGVAMFNRSGTSKSRARAAVQPAERLDPLYASTKPPRMVEGAPRLAVSRTAVASPSPAAPTVTPKLENADKNQPFIEARREPRDSVWALQMESGVREVLAAVPDKKVALENVQCASIRCTLEGTIGQRGKVEDVVNALNKAGLTRGRFKRVQDSDGTTRFSAVFARKGYKLDGSPKEEALKKL